MKLNVKGEDEAKKDYKVHLKKSIFIIFEYLKCVPQKLDWAKYHERHSFKSI